MILRRTALLATTCLVVTSACGGARATQYRFDIPAQDLSSALKAFAAQSGAPIMASPDLVAGRESRPAEGRLPAARALADMLAGSGLHADVIGGAFVVRRDEAATVPADPATEITVTGTRIRGSAPIGSPVIVIDRKAIEDSGRATIADYIQTLPQNFGGGSNEGLTGNTARNYANANVGYGASINLRGLGTNSTLVLFDGSRPALGGIDGVFTDTSVIPSVAVKRIEVLTDGASAIYGSDAVAGVVNVRFRNHFQGFETHLYSGTADGSFTQLQFAQAAGKRWNGGGAMIAYQYDSRGRLSGSDRRASTQDLRPFGGPDNRSTYATPANILGADGTIYGVSPHADPEHLTAADLVPDAPNKVDDQKIIDLLPRQRTHSLYASADQTIAPALSLFAHALYTHRTFDIRVLPYNSPIEVDPGNPYYIDPDGNGAPILVERDFRQAIGRPASFGTVQAISLTGGAQGDFGRWHYELSGSYGRQTERTGYKNFVNSVLVQDAVDDPDPTTSFNPFGPISAAKANAFRGSIENYSRYSVWSASARLDGSLLKLPAGWAKLAFGAEYRHEAFTTSLSDTVYSETRETSAIAGTPAQRHIEAVYAELLVPVFNAETRLPGRLDVSAAGRIERYSDVGHTTNPKVGISWQPTQGLTLRASYGTSFRAPSFIENIGSSYNFYEPLVLSDPASPTGQTAVIGKFGNVASIGPERARTWSAGIDLKPKAIPGLSLTATYFHIDYRDRIASAANDYPSFLIDRNVYAGLIEDNPSASVIAAYYALPGFTNPDGIAASDIKAIIDGETRNLSSVVVRGLDANIVYSHPLLGGTATASLDATRLFALDQKVTANAPSRNIVSTYANPVKLRARGSVGWSNDRLSMLASLNYTGAYSNTLILPAEHVKHWTTLDGQIGYRFAKASPLAGARIALNATNLFNTAPPYMNNSFYDSILAYDPGQASAIGRVLSIEATFSW
jgi:outer membrane receptor protein involved in Fe transport